MLSVAAYIGQAKVRKSKPAGLSCSRSERIIVASRSAQNGRTPVALPRKNEGTERLSITLPLDEAGAQHFSVTDSCRDVHDVSGCYSLINIAHSHKF
jgi:hypothetical protein